MLIKPANIEPALESAAQFRALLDFTPEMLAAHSQQVHLEKVRSGLLATPSFVEAVRAPENNEAAAIRFEWKVVGAKACILNCAKRPELNGRECEIRSIAQAGLHSVRVLASGELLRVEVDSLARPSSARAVHAAAAVAGVPCPPPPATADRPSAGDESVKTSAQITHSENCTKLMDYMDRRGHFVCRLDGAGKCVVVQVVQASKAGGPRPSEFPFSASGNGMPLKAGSFNRLDATQANYVPILLGDVVLFYNQRHEEAEKARKAEEARVAAEAAAVTAAEESAAAEAAASKGSKKVKQKKARKEKAALHAEEEAARAQEAERMAHEAQQQAELEEQHAEQLRRAEERRRRARKAEEEKAAAAVRAERRKEVTEKMRAAAAFNAAAVAEARAARERAAKDRDGEDADGGILDHDASEAAAAKDETAAASTDTVAAQVLADFQMAKMLSQMDDETGEWQTLEKKRRTAGRALEAAAELAKGLEFSAMGKAGVVVRLEEHERRRAARAAQRVIERINHVVREGAQGSDDHTREATVRQMLAESASAANDGEPVSEQFMQAVEARVAGLVRAGVERKDAMRIHGQLEQCESFVETLRLFKANNKSWPPSSLSYLWTRLARWAKEERRVGREALGDELERLLDETLSVLVTMGKDGQRPPSFKARILTVIVAAAAKLELRPENSEHEAALFSIVDEGTLSVLHKASFHHVATLLWANGKAGALRARTWPLAERLFLERGIEHFNDGLSFQDNSKFTDASMTMVNLSMLLTGLANASRQSDELCNQVAAELPTLLRKMRMHNLPDDHVAVVNIVHAFAKLEYVNVPAFNELARAGLHSCASFSTQNVSNTVWSFAKAQVPAPELFGALALHATSRVNDFSEQGLSMTLWAYARADVAAPSLFAAFARVARHRIQTYTEQSLVNTLWAFGKADYNTPEAHLVFEAAIRYAQPKLGTFLSEHTSQLLQAINNSTFRSSIVDKLASTVCENHAVVSRMAEYGDEQCHTVTLHSLASLGFPVPGPVASQLVYALLKLKPDTRHITITSWALMTAADAGGVGSALGGLLDLLSARAVSLSSKFNNKDCALLSWVLWKGCCEHGRGFSPVAKDCVLTLAAHATVEELSNHDLSNLATVFHHCPELSVPSSLVEELSNLQRRLDTFEPQHFAACVRFLATSQIATPKLWADIEMAWMHRIRSEPQATVSVVWAIGTVGAAATRLHSALGSSEVLGRILESQNAQWLANLAWGCATSEVGLPSIFGPLCDAAAALLRRSPQAGSSGLIRFKLAELSMLLWAVSAAGFHVQPQAKVLLEAAMAYVAGCDLSEGDGQSLCNLLWVFAVADVREHRAMLRRLNAHFLSLLQSGRIIRRGMSQVHQYQLWVQLELKEDALLFEPAIRQRCREAMEATHAAVSVSGFQQHVARVVRNLELTYQLEENISGYSVDLALPSSRIVIEVDGPHHYLYNFAPGRMNQSIENAKSKVVAVNGASMLKERIMRALGWRPVSIPFFEFELMQNPYDPTAVTAEHKRYLNAKLAAARK